MQYSTTIKYSNNMGDKTAVFETLSEARQFADDQAIVGDTVVITEAFTAADEGYIYGDHITSWKVDVDPVGL